MNLIQRAQGHVSSSIEQCILPGLAAQQLKKGMESRVLKIRLNDSNLQSTEQKAVVPIPVPNALVAEA